MTIDKIYYQRNFRIGEFLYENIGIGIAINEGEDAKNALDQAKDLVEQYHRDNMIESLAHQTEELPMRDIQVNRSEVSVDYDTVIEEINKCQTREELKGWQAISFGNVDAIKAYADKLQMLNF